MEERGFIRDMLDVKVLILFVAAKAKYPLTLQKIYELCYQDDRLSYFDVSIAVPQMVESGHLEQLPDGTYVVTQKGAEQEEVTRDSIAFPVMQRALAAVERFNAQTRRGEFVRRELVELENGNLLVCSSQEDFSSVEDRIVEIDRKTGEVVYELNVSDLIDPSDGGLGDSKDCFSPRDFEGSY